MEDGGVDFKWTVPLEPKEDSVILKVESNSSNGNSAPTGDALRTLQELVPQEQTLHFAQFANGNGWVSRIHLLTPGTEKAVNARLELRDDQGMPLSVVLNSEQVEGETGEIAIPAGGAAVFERDGKGSVTVRADGLLSEVVLFDGEGGGQGVAGVDSSESLAGFRAPVETRSGDRVVRTDVAVMNPVAEEKTLEARRFDLEGAVVGTGTITADPLPGHGYVARFVDEFIWDEPAPDLTDFQGVLEVVALSCKVAATVLKSSPGTLASLPVW